jgi:hypothetical protein
LANIYNSKKKSLGIHRTSVEKFSLTIATKNIYNSKKKSLGIHRTSVEKFYSQGFCVGFL